jgi:very-short-patch-repair endonuclease
MIPQSPPYAEVAANGVNVMAWRSTCGQTPTRSAAIRHHQQVSILEILQRCGGTATFAELRGSVSGRAIRGALADGAIRRIAKGVYAMPPAADPFAAARAQGGVVSHVSAAVLHGFSVLELPAKPHITVPRGQHRRLSSVDCELHWADGVPSDGRVTGKLRTVLDCARTLPFDAALAIADSALRLGAVDRSQLLIGAAELSGPGCLRARRVAAAADGRAESPLESVLRSILIEADIDGFEPQVVVRDDGFSARIDLGHPGLLIALEADSFAHHGTRKALTRDCRRHVNLTIRGWRLLRFSWEDVMFDREWVVDVIRQAVAGSPGHHNAPATSLVGGRSRALRRV